MLDEIKDLIPLAPLHNPAAVSGIEAARAEFDVPHVAIFDTAFFSTLPLAAATYAIPRDLAQKYRIRRYGFHGTSHQFVSRAAAELVGRDLGELNQIVLHLGNGCSASAVRGGVAVETSMGLTPLQGLVMGTRSGDVDPGLHTFSRARRPSATSTLLNKQSGLKGMAGVNDFRELEERRAAGDEAAQLAFDVYVIGSSITSARTWHSSVDSMCSASRPASRRTTQRCGLRWSTVSATSASVWIRS